MPSAAALALFKQLRQRGTTFDLHDIDAMIAAFSGGSGGNYGSVETGIAPFTTAGGSTPSPGSNTPALAIVGANIVAGPTNGITVLGNPSPRFTVDAGNGGDYALTFHALAVTAFAGGDGGVTWDFYFRRNGTIDLGQGHRITTGASIGDVVTVNINGVITLAAGDFIELWVEPTTANDLTINSYMATLNQVA